MGPGLCSGAAQKGSGRLLVFEQSPGRAVCYEKYASPTVNLVLNFITVSKEIHNHNLRKRSRFSWHGQIKVFLSAALTWGPVGAMCPAASL